MYWSLENWDRKFFIFLHIMIYLLCKRFRRKFTNYCFIMISAKKNKPLWYVLYNFWLKIFYWRLVRKFCDKMVIKIEYKNSLYYFTHTFSTKIIVTILFFFYITIKCYCLPTSLIALFVVFIYFMSCALFRWERLTV